MGDYVWHYARSVRGMSVSTHCGKLDEPATGATFDRDCGVYIGKELLVLDTQERFAQHEELGRECFACLTAKHNADALNCTGQV